MKSQRGSPPSSIYLGANSDLHAQHLPDAQLATGSPQPELSEGFMGPLFWRDLIRAFSALVLSSKFAKGGFTIASSSSVSDVVRP